MLTRRDRSPSWLPAGPTTLGPVLARALSVPMAWQLLSLACLAAAVSIGLQGYYFGVINNSYHIPIVEGWFNDPQFATDQYIQSLRYHTSYVWPFARVMTRWLSTYDTFVVLHVANRLAMFVGFALLLRQLGVRTLAGLSAGLMTLALTRYLLAASGPGEHDLFMPFLNHSSLTWPFLFASWLFLLRGQLVAALAMQGPVFAINAFVAICGGPAVAAGALVFRPAGRQLRRVFAWRLIAGIGLALLIAAPTIAWILASYTDQPAAAPFSFIAFLKSYYLKHWYVTAASPRRLVSFVIVGSSGLLCLHLLGDRAKSLIPVWWGYLAVFAAGALLPYVLDSRTLLVLHPMRVGAGCLVMLSVLVIVAQLSQVLEEPGRALRRYAGAVGLLGFAAGQAGLLLMAAAVVVTVLPVRRSLPFRRRIAGGGSAALAWLAAGLLGVGAWRARYEPPPYDGPLLTAARDAGQWVRAHTAPGSMMFVPSGAIDGEDDPVSLWARRPVWYDWKEGAAVMWTPSYYQEWASRRADAATLRTVDEVLAYGCSHGIAVVVETTDRLRDPVLRQRLQAAIAYSNTDYVVLRPARLCRAQS